MVVGTYDVVRLITRLNIGGPARQALLLTRDLERWRTLLAAGQAPPHEGELDDPRVRVERVPLVRPVRPRPDAAALRRVRALLRQVKPRILHTHMAKAGIVGRLAATRSPIRTVHTYHGHVLDGYFAKPVERVFLEVERQLARSTDVLIAISPEIRDDLLDKGVGKAGQYEVIPLGFDLTEHLAVTQRSGLLRASLGLDERVPLVGTVARLVPIKDLQTLLHSMTLLPDVHLAILGDGEERETLEGTARALGLSDRCHFTGWWQDIPSAMSDMDVVALTSLNEGTPVSLIEALACGRPVVATEVGGVPFVVRDGRTGLLVRAGDAQGAADAIRALLSSRALGQQLAREGRAVVRERFHKDRLLADIDDLYGDLTGAGTSSSTRSA